MRLLTLFVLFLSFDTLAQNSDIFRIDSLPTEGVLLDKGWRWHAGDNPDFAKADFDDSKWEAINPTLDIIDSLPQIPRPSGICWFRIKLKFDKGLPRDVLAFAILQSGASEVYMNGKLAQKYGIVSSDPDKIKAYDPLNDPIPFSIHKDTTVLLALRYTLQPNIDHYLMALPNPAALKITITTLEIVQSKKITFLLRFYTSNVFRIGAFLILLISYFALYL